MMLASKTPVSIPFYRQYSILGLYNDYLALNCKDLTIPVEKRPKKNY